MNGIEVPLIIAAAACTFLLLQACNASFGRNLLLIISVSPALFIAMEAVTEVVTCDETYMLSNITDVQAISARQWLLDNYHTSIAITGNIVSFLGRIFSLDGVQAKILAKSAHWCLGFVALAGIFWTISRNWIRKEQFAYYCLIFFYSALLLPTNILSLKVANYDMFAMMLGIWGVVCACIGCQIVRASAYSDEAHGLRPWRRIISEMFLPDKGFALYGIVLTTLAAQEKQIAAPFLNLAIILAILMRLRRRGRVSWWSLFQFGLCIFVICLVLVLTYGAVAIWRAPNLPRFDLVRAFGALFFHFDILFRTVGMGGATFLVRFGLLASSVIMLGLLCWWLRRQEQRIATVVGLLFPLLLLSSIAVGAFGFYQVKAYVHPVYPIPSGNFIPTEEVNGEIIHFLSQSRLQHVTRNIGYAYSIFAICFPSVFVLVSALILGTRIWMRRVPTAQLIGFQAIGVLSLLMPLVYALTNTAVGTRYFDVWVFITVLILGIVGCDLFAYVPSTIVKYSVVLSFCFFLLLETVPFRPVIGAFWPWWARPTKLENSATPKLGCMTPVWPGWGEEVMLAGRELRKMARERELPSGSFRLFTVYPGDWLARGEATAVYRVDAAPYLSFTEKDYYVLNRAALVQGRCRFPGNAKPIWILAYRGFPEAWVFRGSDLSDAEQSH